MLQPYTSFPRGASSTKFEIRYGYNSFSQTNRVVDGTLSQYTLTNLLFEQNYTISIRAQVYYSECYGPFLYGDYSEVSARTVESGTKNKMFVNSLSSFFNYN